MSPTPTPSDFDPVRQLEIARRALARRSFCILATVSPANRPQAVGLNYIAVDLTLYLLTSRDSVKVRNIRENPAVAVCVPVRKYLFGPPMAVQFQGTAEVLEPTDPAVQKLIRSGRMRRIAALGVLDKPEVCLLRVVPGRRISTYGLGIPLLRLLRDVSRGTRTVSLP